MLDYQYSETNTVNSASVEFAYFKKLPTCKSKVYSSLLFIFYRLSLNTSHIVEAFSSVPMDLTFFLIGRVYCISYLYQNIKNVTKILRINLSVSYDDGESSICMYVLISTLTLWWHHESARDVSGWAIDGEWVHDNLKTPADPKHEIDKSYTYGKLFFLWI